LAAEFGITMEAKNLFFDRQAVTSQVDAATRKALSKAGAFVRRSSRSSIRRRKRVSRPGEPPSAHSTDPVASIKNILFAYEPQNQSVVIGPVRLNGKQVVGGAIVSGTVPQTLEFGGTVGLREKRVGKRWVSIGRRKARPGQPTRIRKVKYAPRPFMGPALDREAPKFPTLWANSVRA
jgi:hypothetical protein